MARAKKQVKKATGPKRGADNAPGKAPRRAGKAARRADAGLGVPEARGGGKKAKEGREKAGGKFYSVVEAFSSGQAAAFEKLEPMVRKFAASLREAGQSLTMPECAALLSKVSKSGNPAKHAAWIFCKRLRPAGLLVEDRG